MSENFDALAALRELVELKDLKNDIDAWSAGSTNELAEMSADYQRRKPQAWERARAVLAAPAAQRTDAVTPYEILKAFRDAGMNLEPTPNALYTVRGQHAQLIEGVRTLLKAAQDDGRVK